MSSIVEQYSRLFSQDQLATHIAQRYMVDGVNSDSRYSSPFPIHISHAQGSKKWSLSGKELIDYWSGHGALLFGHAPPDIVAAVSEQIQMGTHFGACQPYEAEWAKLVIDLIPSAERVRFTASGTEANTLAIQLARAYTGKRKLLRFTGHYHGWTDALILGSDLMSSPQQRNVTTDIIANTLICPPHDMDCVENYLRKEPDIAGVLLEPTGASFGVIPCNTQFLSQLRELTDYYGVLLIFDEVVTGFRVAPGGAQEHYHVTPDITTLAKVLAGGLPGGAVVGKKAILDSLSTASAENKVSHLGTFNGNPLSAVAGIATLKQVKTGLAQQQVNESAQQLRDGFNEIIDQHHLDWVVYGEFSALKFLIGHGNKQQRTTDFDPYSCPYQQLMKRGNKDLYQALRLSLLINGVDISLSSTMTTAHSETDIQQTLLAFQQSIHLMEQEHLI